MYMLEHDLAQSRMLEDQAHAEAALPCPPALPGPACDTSSGARRPARCASQRRRLLDLCSSGAHGINEAGPERSPGAFGAAFAVTH